MAVYSQHADRIDRAHRTTERVKSRAYCPGQNSCFQVYQAVWSGAILLTLLNFLICTYTLGGCEVWLTLSLVESLVPDQIDRWFSIDCSCLHNLSILRCSFFHTLTSLRMHGGWWLIQLLLQAEAMMQMPLPQHGNHGTAVPLVTPTESHPLSVPQHWV